MSTKKAAVVAVLALFAVPAAALAQEHSMGCGSGAGCGSGSMTTTTGEPVTPTTKAPEPTAKPAKADAKVRKIEVAVTDAGFVPAKIDVKKGERVQLVVTRKTDATCAKAIVIKDQKVNADLPLNKAVTVDVKTDKAGNIHFSCPMDMITGEITVK